MIQHYFARVRSPKGQEFCMQFQIDSKDKAKLMEHIKGVASGYFAEKLAEDCLSDEVAILTISSL